MWPRDTSFIFIGNTVKATFVEEIGKKLKCRNRRLRIYLSKVFTVQA